MRSACACMGCGTQPGAPYYCESCQRTLADAVAKVRTRTLLSALTEIGMPPGIEPEEKAFEVAPRGVYFALDPRARHQMQVSVATMVRAWMQQRAHELPAWRQDWHKDVRWVQVADLMRLARKDEDDVVDEHRLLDGLILDGVGLEHVTPWSSQVLHHLLEERRALDLAGASWTVVLTTFPPQSVEDMYGRFGAGIVQCLNDINDGPQWVECEWSKQ